jgi:hypothetical protein
MSFQDQLVKSTQKALDDICRAALAVPADKIDWVPMGSARSVLSQMQEIAGAPKWFLPIIRDRKQPDFKEHARRAAQTGESLDTIEKCIEEARRTTGELVQAIAAFPTEDLDMELTLPFGGGMVMTMADILGMHQWNMIYHLGQINQIQLMLGDSEMH